MSDRQHIETMRAALRRRGTSPVVRLQLNHAYFNEDYVQQCVDEVERVIRRTPLEPASPLERLAIHLLLDSAGIERG